MSETPQEAPGAARASTVEDQERRVRALLIRVYQGAGATDGPAPWQELGEELARYDRMLRRAGTPTDSPGPPTAGAPGGVFLGPETTGLEVTTAINLNPVPTGIYNLLDAETEPLLTVTVKNTSDKDRRVCVRATIEGLSATAVKTVELPQWGGGRADSPPSHPPARGGTEYQRDPALDGARRGGRPRPQGRAARHLQRPTDGPQLDRLRGEAAERGVP